MIMLLVARVRFQRAGVRFQSQRLNSIRSNLSLRADHVTDHRAAVIANLCRRWSAAYTIHKSCGSITDFILV